MDEKIEKLSYIIGIILASIITIGVSAVIIALFIKFIGLLF